MFTKLKSRRCGNLHAGGLMIAQALVWAGVTIAVAVELRGLPAAENVVLWMSTGAFTSLMLQSGTKFGGRCRNGEER